MLTCSLLLQGMCVCQVKCRVEQQCRSDTRVYESASSCAATLLMLPFVSQFGAESLYTLRVAQLRIVTAALRAAYQAHASGSRLHFERGNQLGINQQQHAACTANFTRSLC
jgi:hypothetical protein